MGSVCQAMGCLDNLLAYGGMRTQEAAAARIEAQVLQCRISPWLGVAPHVANGQLTSSNCSGESGWQVNEETGGRTSYPL